MTSNKIARLERLFKDTLRERDAHWEREFHNAQTSDEKLKVRQLQAQDSNRLYSQFEERMRILATQTEQKEQLLEESKVAVAELSQALDESASKIAHDNSTIEALQSGVGELSDTVHHLKQRIRETTQSLKDADKQKSILTKKTQNMQMTSEQLGKCLNELHETKSESMRETARLNQELSSTLDNVAACKQSVADLKRELHAEKSHREKLLEQLEHWTTANRDLTGSVDHHKHELALERSKLAKAHEDAKMSQSEQTEYFKHQLSQSDSQMQAIAAQCDTLVKNLKVELLAKDAQLAHLEETLVDTKHSHQTEHHISSEQIAELQNMVQSLSRDNSDLRALVTAFQNNQNQSTVPLVEMIQETHRKLVEDYESKEADLVEQDEKLEENTNRLQSCASEVQLLKGHTKQLETKMQTCLFPGEKRILTEQLQETIDKHNRLKEGMTLMAKENRQYQLSIQALKTEMHALRNLVEKYSLDLNSMSRLTKESAHLSSKLIEAQNAIVEKDKQLKMVSKQLNALLSHSQTLESHAKQLKHKLRFTSSPKELEALNAQLIQCKINGQKTSEDASKLHQLVVKLEEFNKVNDLKIRSLIEVLKSTEDAKEMLAKEHASKVQLEQALLTCAKQRHDIEAELGARLAALDKQYQANLVHHAQVMNAANARIAQLEAGAPAKRQINVDQVVNNARNDVHHAKETRDPHKAAQLVMSQSSRDMQALRSHQFQAMQAKEAQMMSNREQSLDEIRDALTREDAAERVQEIQARTQAREQQYYKDMLEMQAVHDRVMRESDNMRRAQWELLQEANLYSKQSAIDMVESGQSAQFSNVQKLRDSVAASQESYIDSGRRELEEQLEAQNRYAGHLKESILPKMRETQAMVETINIPALENLRARLEADSQTSLEALDREEGEAEDQRRSVSLLEQRLKAMQSERNRLSNAISTWIAAPGPKARTDVLEAAKDDAAEVMKRARAAKDLNDNRKVRLNFVVQPRTPEQVAAGIPVAGPDQLNVDLDKQQVVITQNGLPTKFHGHTLSVLEGPNATLTTPIPRFERAVVEKKDLIVVSYAYENVANAKYTVFLNAVEKVFGTIRTYLRDSQSFDVKMVRISSDIERYDLIGNVALPQDCNFVTCKSKSMKINKLASGADIMSQIKQFLPESISENTHTVLSLLFPGHTIHIVDVLYSNPNEDYRLLDRSWLEYLQPVITTNDFYIDLYFNLLSTQNDLEQTRGMLQLSRRLATFLAEFQTLASQ